MKGKLDKNLLQFASGITFQKAFNLLLVYCMAQFSDGCRKINIFTMPCQTSDTNQDMFLRDSVSPRLTTKSERMDDILKTDTEERSFIGLIRRSESLSSSGSSSNRNSTTSSSSISSEGESFSRFPLPLELELSVMGTVDQSLLDRAQVALVKRSRNLEIGQFSPSRSLFRVNTTRSLDRIRKAKGSNTQMDNQGLLTTTLCSTEL